MPARRKRRRAPETLAEAVASARALVVVEVDGVRCGFSAMDVVELHPVVRITPLPRAPQVVEGVINVRGSLVTVIDLRARLGLHQRPPLVSDHLVIVRVGTRTVALRVDRALQLVTVDTGRIESALGLDGARHVRAVAKLDDGLIVIHDLEAFLSAEEALALDGALVEADAAAKTSPEQLP